MRVAACDGALGRNQGLGQDLAAEHPPPPVVWGKSAEAIPSSRSEIEEGDKVVGGHEVRVPGIGADCRARAASRQRFGEWLCPSAPGDRLRWREGASFLLLEFRICDRQNFTVPNFLLSEAKSEARMSPSIQRYRRTTSHVVRRFGGWNCQARPLPRPREEPEGRPGDPGATVADLERSKAPRARKVLRYAPLDRHVASLLAMTGKGIANIRATSLGVTGGWKSHGKSLKTLIPGLETAKLLPAAGLKLARTPSPNFLRRGGAQGRS